MVLYLDSVQLVAKTMDTSLAKTSTVLRKLKNRLRQQKDENKANFSFKHRTKKCTGGVHVDLHAFLN
jgi:hypothetical protein